MSIITVDKNNFETEVMNSDKPVLVDFWASWCSSCRSLTPTLEQIANERKDIKVCKLNIQDESEIAARLDIMSVPTLTVIENGRIKAQASGVRPKQEILNMLD